MRVTVSVIDSRLYAVGVVCLAIAQGSIIFDVPKDFPMGAIRDKWRGAFVLDLLEPEMCWKRRRNITGILHPLGPRLRRLTMTFCRTIGQETLMLKGGC
jgi:hypothetical protein